MEMEGQLWSRLSDEIIDIVLSFLPVPDLLRYSTVCKRWQQLISNDEEFGRLCLQNAKEGRCYIVVRAYGLGSSYDRLSWFHGWSILDVENKRWYSFVDLNSHNVKGVLENDCGLWAAFASDGGLVCEHTETNDNYLLQVCNPLQEFEGREEVLPNPPGHAKACRSDALITLVVNDEDGDTTFTVFFIYRNFREKDIYYGDGGQNSSEKICDWTTMHIYDSTTKKWRRTSNPDFDEPDVGIGCSGSSIMFQKLLYVMFSSYHGSVFWLCTYDIGEDEWVDRSVNIDRTLIGWLISPQLVVSDNRLFLVSNSYPGLKIEEIVDMALFTVVEMAAERVKLVFHSEERSTPQGEEHEIPTIEAFGFEKSIMLMSKNTGIFTVYNLVSCLWSEMPKNPMDPYPPYLQMSYGKPMNLRMPSFRWRSQCA